MEAVPSLDQVRVKIEEVTLGFRWMLACCLVVFAIPNYCFAFELEKFPFPDPLNPGKQLPGVVYAVISIPGLLRLLALAWPAIGLLRIIYGRQPRTWIISTAIFATLIGIQLLACSILYFSSMFGQLVGTAEPTTH